MFDKNKFTKAFEDNPYVTVAAGCGKKATRFAKSFAKRFPSDERHFYITYSSSGQTIQVRELYNHKIVQMKSLNVSNFVKPIRDDICYLCLEPFGEEKPTKDHFKPKSKGGSNNSSNIVYTHRVCNSFKGSYIVYDLVQFRTWCKKFRQEHSSPEDRRKNTFKKYRSFMLEKDIIRKI